MHVPRSALVLMAATALAAAIAACGGDDGDTSSTAPVSTAPATATTDSGAPSTTSGTEGTQGTFPLTITHAFGETVIAAEPTRVVTWGWASADAAIAVGVVPVAIPYQAYGGDENGVLPWIHEALDELGAEVPTVLPDTTEVPLEAIAAAQPDLVLAPYSGITDNEYARLSQIAPTVAYPGEAWSTPWREVITTVGTALGRSVEADAVLADIDAQVAAQAAAHPEFAGRTVTAVWDTADAFYVYKPADPRVEFTLDLGFTSAPSVDELSTDESTFYFSLSHERLAELTSDVLISYADTPDLSASFLASSAAQLMPQVANGAVAEVTGPAFVASVSPPTALSLTWGLDDYVDLLAGAVATLDAG